jgi:hypothetical protein
MFWTYSRVGLHRELLTLCVHRISVPSSAAFNSLDGLLDLALP